MRKLRILIPATIILAVTSAQNVPQLNTVSGTINGESIPEKTFSFDRGKSAARFIYAHHRLPSGPADEQEITSDWQRQLCGNLRSVIGAASSEAEIRRQSILVTPAEIQEAGKYLIPNNEEMARTASARRGTALVLAAGLAAVYDRGQDAKLVYGQMIQGHGVTEDMWLDNVYTARTPEGRQRVESDATLTPETLARQMAAAKPELAARSIAERAKLDKRVDELLAASDPGFRAYLAESTPDASHHSLPTAHHQYLEQKRAEWWKDSVSRLKVWLSDQSLYGSCQLPQMGVTAGSK